MSDAPAPAGDEGRTVLLLVTYHLDHGDTASDEEVRGETSGLLGGPLGPSVEIVSGLIRIRPLI